MPAAGLAGETPHFHQPSRQDWCQHARLNSRTAVLVVLLAASAFHTCDAASRARKHASRPSPEVTQVQQAVLRYTGVLAMPADLRQSLVAELAPVGRRAAATTPSDGPCQRPSNAPGEKVVPCLGLGESSEVPSPVRVRFDLALKSIGAPKEALFGQCPAGTQGATCRGGTEDGLAMQERVADVLSGQRRYPFATLGLALSF